jgi:glycosyltransferase involved in cell wall biosynthesis
MKVSVVLPVFNKEAFLEEAVHSILGQSFNGPMEVIAIDDASTDRSGDILRSITDPRLKVIASESNLGPGMAAQLGHQKAMGEYIVRADADDIQVADRIRQQVEFMDEHPEMGISGTFLQLMGTDEIRERPLNNAECQVELLFGVAVQQPSMILRRSVLVEHDIRYLPHWPRYGEDWLFQLQLARITRSGNISLPLVRYRPGGISTLPGPQVVAGLMKEVFSFYGFKDASDEDIGSHRMLAYKYPDRIPPDTIVALRQWIEKLRVQGLGPRIDPDLLDRRLRKAWNDLFYRLPGQGLSSILAWLKNGGHIDLQKTYYLLRSFKMNK